ncbi:MAG: DNA repair protein RecO [Bacteroidaceae bacterium]
MEERTHGIVLRKVRYNDTGMIVDIFTASRGTVSFLAKTGKGNRIKAPLLTPLAIVDIGFRWRQQHTLQHLDDVQTAMPYATLGIDPIRTSVAMFLQEFLYHALKNEVANEPLFEYVTESMKILDGTQEGLANFHLAFMIRLTHYLGLRPRTENWQQGDMLDLKEGFMTGKTPEHRFWIAAEETARIPVLARMTFSNMKHFKMNHVQRNAILDGLIAYYRLHVPEFPELRSLEILREIFA